MLTLDDQGIIRDIDQAAALLIGSTRPQLLNRSFPALLEQCERELFETHLKAVRASEHPRTCDIVIRRSEGSVLVAECRSEHLMGGADYAGWCRTTIRDISGHGDDEAAACEDDRRYRNLVESSPVAICLHQAGECVYINPAALELLGARKLEDVKSGCLGFIHPLFRSAVAARIREAEELGRRTPVQEMKILTLDGREIDVEAVATPVLFGKKRAAQVTIHDMTDHGNTELRLRLQATVLSQVNDAVVAVGLDGRIIFWNEAAERLYRMPAREAIGRPRQDIFRYRWMTPEAGQAARDSLLSSGFLCGENIHVLKSGEEKFVESTVSVLHGWSGKPAGWLAVMRDITERKVFQQKLQESEERQRAVFDNSPMGIFVKDLQGRFILVNRQLEKWLEVPADDLISKTDYDIFPREVADICTQNDRRVFAAGTVLETEEVVSYGGRERIHLITKFPLFDADGKPCAICGISTDISERKRAEEGLKRAQSELELRVRERTAELAATIEALQEEIAERKRTAAERNRLVAAVESTAEAIVITDTRGIIQYVNPAFELVTGYTRAEAVGRDLHMLDSGQNDEEFYRRMREKISTEGVWKGRLINKKKDGTIYYEDCTYSPVRDPQGKIINFISIKHDVTAKLRLESIAETVDTMNNIGYVFSGIRHEIGNPVSSLLIIMNLLKKKYDAGPKEAIKEYVDQAILQVERLEYLLSSLKSFNMYESLQIRTTEMADFMEKFLTLIGPDLLKKGIQLDTEEIVDDAVLAVDARALQQALLNVVVNASDALAGRPRPTIAVSTARNGSMVRIRVADNGAGIAEERKKDLFKPFHTTKSQGTGLGLVIAQKLVSRMSGFIEIESTVDVGTSVDIHLPEGIVEHGA